jgi:molybdate transport system substrate-binding protein
MREVRVLSGGAAQGLFKALEPRLQQRGLAVTGTFGAVGLMRDKLLAGEACDLLVLTDALVGQLVEQGHVRAGSARPLGRVRTGVAVVSGEPVPDVTSADQLAALLRGASSVYFPDPEKATAGIHFMKVLRELGLATVLADRLRVFPNGTTAMREMAASGDRGAVGCTQVTEILYTPGVRLAGGLPKQFELATVYTASVCTHAAAADAAQQVADLLSSTEAAALRAAGGFDPL